MVVLVSKAKPFITWSYKFFSSHYGFSRIQMHAKYSPFYRLMGIGLVVYIFFGKIMAGKKTLWDEVMKMV